MSYVQRISVVSAYHFDGHVQTAPAWVDRNWLAWNDLARDERGTGIVLELPGVGICRVGDYIVQQDVLIDGLGTRVAQLAVYDRDEFERMFLPVSQADPGVRQHADAGSTTQDAAGSAP